MRPFKSKPTIRKADADDIKQMKLIAADVGFKNYVPFLGQSNVDEYLGSGLLEKDIEEHLASTVVCEFEEQIVGMCAFWDDFVHVLLVKYAFQGGGFGKALLDYAQSQMFENNAVIKLETFEKNVAAIAFYQKNGWKVVGSRYSEYINGNYVKLEKTRAGTGC
ncbi:MAG: GNAT family N-acetyltransferase [Clostridia bacterium]|jgi:ribosomal protein S18 acetylase RimI-like enzyme|nr:GNAT family N-acetyltransferase [Clostridia bacterium]MBT7121655.1 GNAT family N-acetyltransferase [Clostridia bacterium]